MSSDRFKQIEEIYHAALKMDAVQRAVYLETQCGDDTCLKKEVEELLYFEENPISFINTSPDELAADVLADRLGHDILGKQIVHYRIISQIGSGGMGEVFLAEDTKLFRKVALKLLPAQFSSNRERKLRFEQEARALSALNHRNIITIHEIQDVDDLSFMATEFVDGETLSARIGAGTIPWQEAAAIGAQIASALDAAHSLGIIHRDIKPANIMIRQDGDVKVLDFGLAKLTTPKAASGSFDTKDHNAQNRVMGTIHYMSPEQALGSDLDTRTDIFSLGVVLYEMLTGKRPFSGPSDAAVYNAIINTTPEPVSSICPEIPKEFEHIVGLIMSKERDGRLASAAELRDALQNISSADGNRFRLRTMPGSSWIRRSLPALGAAAFVLIVIFGIWAAYLNKAVAVAKEPAKNFRFTQLTTQTGEELFPSFSPDGRTYIYSGRQGGNWDIYLQKTGDTTPVNLTQASIAGDTQGVFSPDGGSIAFRSERDGGGLYVMRSDGSDARRISDLGFYPAWSPDSTEIAFCVDDFQDPGDRTITPSELWRINVTTGEKHLITSSDAVQPSWSPNGQRIAFWGISPAGKRDVFTVSATGGEVLPVTTDAATDWNPVWSTDGKSLYFLSDRDGSMNLWQVAIEETSGTITGKPASIRLPSKYSKFLRFSSDGRSFSYVQTTNDSNLARIYFDPRSETAGETIVKITDGSKIYTNPNLARDGQSLTFGSVGDIQEDIYTSGPNGDGIRQVTNDVFKDRSPRWAPDGKRISFFSDASGKYECWIMNADGTGRQQISRISEDGWAQIPVWSPDGRRLLCNTTFSYPLIYDLETMQPSPVPPPVSANNEPAHRFMAYGWSPDGRKLIGQRLALDGTSSSIQTYDLETNMAEIISDLGLRPVWLSDSRRCIFSSRDKLYLADTYTKKIKEILSIAPNRFNSIAISSDDRTLYYAMQKSESDIWQAVAE